MESKNLGEILKKWSGINLKEDTILIFGKDNVKFDSLEDAVKAGEFQPTLKRASDLVIEDLNGLKLEVTEKEDLKDLYNFLKSWFGDSDKPLKKNEPFKEKDLPIREKELEELKIKVKPFIKGKGERSSFSSDLKKEIFEFYRKWEGTINKTKLAKGLGIDYQKLVNTIKYGEKS